MNKPLLIEFFQQTINAALHYDPGTRNSLHKMTGKTLALQCSSPKYSIYFFFQEESIHVLNATDCEPDITLNGSLSDLFALLFTTENTLANSNVEVSGKVGLLNDIQKLFKNLDIDWEEAINDRLGAVGGHQLSSAIRSTTDWASYAARRTHRALSEFLTEEFKVVPSRMELTYFFNQVNELRADVDRAEARLAQIKNSLKSFSSRGN